MGKGAFDPQATLKKGKTVYLIGEILIALPLLYMALNIWDLLPASLVENWVALCVVFGACWIPGIPITLYGRPIKQRGERYMLFIAYAKNEKIASERLGAIIYRAPHDAAEARSAQKSANGMIKEHVLPDLASIASRLKVSEPVVRKELAELMEHQRETR